MPSVGNNQLRILIIPQLRGLNADLAAGVLVRMAKLTADAVTLECWIFLLRLFRRGSEKKIYLEYIFLSTVCVPVGSVQCGKRGS